MKALKLSLHIMHIFMCITLLFLLFYALYLQAVEDGTLDEKEAKKRKRKKKSVDTTPGDEPAAKVHMCMINIILNYLM